MLRFDAKVLQDWLLWNVAWSFIFPSVSPRLLNLSLTSDLVPEQDVIDVIIHVGRNPQGRNLAWKYFREKWDVLNARWGGGSLLAVSSIRLSDSDHCCFSVFLTQVRRGALHELQAHRRSDGVPEHGEGTPGGKNVHKATAESWNWVKLGPKPSIWRSDDLMIWELVLVSLADDQLCRLGATLLFFSHQLVLTFFSAFCVIKIQFSVSLVTKFKSIFFLLLLRRFYVRPIFSNNSNCIIFYFSRFDSLIRAGTRNEERKQ